MKKILLLLLLYTISFGQFTDREKLSFLDTPWLKETIDQIQRVEADGGIIPDKGLLNQEILKAKIDGLWDKYAGWPSAIFGVKKDASGYVSKLYNVKYAVSNIDWVLNGSFTSSGTGAERWNLNNQTIADGVCHFNNLGAGNTLNKYSYQYNLKSGAAYKVTFTIKNYVSGAIRPGLTDKSTVTQVWCTAVSGNGTYSCDIVCPGSGDDGTLYLDPTGVNNTFDIDDVKVFEITSPDLEESTGANQPQLLAGVLYWDGTNDLLTGAYTSGIKSLSIWVNADVVNRSVLDLDGGTHKITIGADSAVTVSGFTSPTLYINGAVGTKITPGAWQNITVSSNTAFNATAIKLGHSSTYFKGYMSKFSLYNSALTASQVTNIYNGGR